MCKNDGHSCRTKSELSSFIHVLIPSHRTSIFTAPPNRKIKQTIKVERHPEAVKVFDYINDFLPAFYSYQLGEGPRPSPRVVIAIGQNFRADYDPGETYTNLLLSVTVCHPQAYHLLAQVTLYTLCCPNGNFFP